MLCLFQQQTSRPAKPQPQQYRYPHNLQWALYSALAGPHLGDRCSSSWPCAASESCLMPAAGTLLHRFQFPVLCLLLAHDTMEGSPSACAKCVLLLTMASKNLSLPILVPAAGATSRT